MSFCKVVEHLRSDERCRFGNLSFCRWWFSTGGFHILVKYVFVSRLGKGVFCFLWRPMKIGQNSPKVRKLDSFQKFHVFAVLLLMEVRNPKLNQLIDWYFFIPMILQGFGTHPNGGCLEFINHQQYHWYKPRAACYRHFDQDLLSFEMSHVFLQTKLSLQRMNKHLGGGFKYFYFHPYLRKWSNLTNNFQVGWFNHQLDMYLGIWSLSFEHFVILRDVIYVKRCVWLISSLGVVF